MPLGQQRVRVSWCQHGAACVTARVRCCRRVHEDEPMAVVAVVAVVAACLAAITRRSMGAEEG